MIATAEGPWRRVVLQEVGRGMLRPRRARAGGEVVCRSSMWLLDALEACLTDGKINPFSLELARQQCCCSTLLTTLVRGLHSVNILKKAALIPMKDGSWADESRTMTLRSRHHRRALPWAVRLRKERKSSKVPREPPSWPRLWSR
jgi:hypothetical protein